MLEFRQKEEGHTLFVEAQDSKGDKGIWFALVTPEEKNIGFDFIGSEEMLHLAVYLNTKLGFDFCNIDNIKKLIQEEKEKPTNCA